MEIFVVLLIFVIGIVYITSQQKKDKEQKPKEKEDDITIEKKDIPDYKLELNTCVIVKGDTEVKLVIITPSREKEVAELTDDKAKVGEDFITISKDGKDYYARLDKEKSTSAVVEKDGNKYYVQKEAGISKKIDISLYDIHEKYPNGLEIGKEYKDVYIYERGEYISSDSYRQLIKDNNKKKVNPIPIPSTIRVGIAYNIDDETDEGVKYTGYFDLNINNHGILTTIILDSYYDEYESYVDSVIERAKYIYITNTR